MDVLLPRQISICRTAPEVGVARYPDYKPYYTRRTKMKRTELSILTVVLALLAAPAALHAQTPMGTAFTYQGQLKQAGVQVDDFADLQFTLWDDPNTPPGVQVGPTLKFDGQPGNPGPVNVTKGLFTVVLDFGNQFNGDARWLEIAVRVPHDPTNTLPYTTLSPRQELTPTPYAVYADTAGSDNDWMISGNDMYSIPSGNVGIGTTSPAAKLHVGRTYITDKTYGAPTPPGVEGSGERVVFQDNSSWKTAIGMNSENGIWMQAQSQYPSGPLLQLWSGTSPGGGISEKVTVTFDGNVGIGTVSPDAMLHVADDAHVEGLFSVGTGALGNRLQIDGDDILNVYKVESGPGTAQPLRLWARGGHLYVADCNNDDPSSEFVWCINGPESNPHERMRLTEGGRLGIGLQWPTSPSEKLDVNGTARLRGISAGSGTTVVADNNGKLWKQSSSRRYKRDISPLAVDVESVYRLEPVSFTWKESGQPEIGLIAEDVERAVPELVIYDAKGRPDGVKYDKVALYLLEVVKAQQAQMTALEQRVTQLEEVLKANTSAASGASDEPEPLEEVQP